MATEPSRQPWEFETDDFVRAVAAADLDGDGDPDLVTAHELGHDVQVMPSNGDGTFQPSLPFYAGAPWP